MLKILVPLLFLIVGVAAGGGAAWFTAPPASPGAANTAPKPATTDTEFVKLGRQFIVPMMENDRVGAMVILALSLEVTLGAADAVRAKEPKLRDVFLQILFDHAQSGGLGKAFTRSGDLRSLRADMRGAARKIAGENLRDVLITDIARQDV